MTVVEFARERRGGAGRGMRMHGAISNDLGFAGGGSGLERAGEGRRAGGLDPDAAARAEALARRVREHREEFALSQQEFARESGISRATLSKIEQGRIYPSMQVRKKLARALGVGPQDLWNTHPKGLSDGEKAGRRQAS